MRPRGFQVGGEMTETLQYVWAGLAGGAAAFAHCLGCGGFALHVSEGGSGRAALGPELSDAGKTATYVALGAGRVRRRRGRLAGGLAGAQKVLACPAGAIMVLMGARLIGLLPGRRADVVGRPLRGRVPPVLRAADSAGRVRVGLMTGLLPCPVVFGFLALSLQSGSVLTGMATMAAMGAGTVWSLLLLGMTGYALRARARRWGAVVGGIVLVLLGTVTILRGTGAMHHLMGHHNSATADADGDAGTPPTTRPPIDGPRPCRAAPAHTADCPSWRRAAPGPLYCCYGCSLASRIVGGADEGGAQAWNVLRLGVGAFLAMNVMMISLLLYTGEVEAGAVPVFRWVLLGLAQRLRPSSSAIPSRWARGRGAARTAQPRHPHPGRLLHGLRDQRRQHRPRRGPHLLRHGHHAPAAGHRGKLIEASAKRRTGELVRGLDALLPPTALRIEPDGPHEVELGALRAGDLLRVLPGGRCPPTAPSRTAPAPSRRQPSRASRVRARSRGDSVFAGTVNGEGALAVRAERVGEDVLLHGIVDMVEEAGDHASPSERLAERAAALFIPAVLALAVGAGLFWLLRAGPAQAGFVALAVIVVACPCAMGIATPLATALAVGRAAREGVLVRGGDVMERIGRIDMLFLDKTGTVTTGAPELVAVEPTDPAVSEDELLGWLAGLESGSEHSLAAAVVAEAQARGLEVGAVRGLRVIPGQGVRGTVARGGVEREVLAGSEDLSSGPPPLPTPRRRT